MNKKNNTRISNKLFYLIMEKEHLNCKFIRNSLFERNVNKLCIENNIDQKDFYKKYLSNFINNQKNNPDTHMQCVKWQRYHIMTTVFKLNNIDVNEFYTSKDITPKLMKEVFYVFNFFKDILNTEPVVKKDLKHFNLIVKNVIGGWNGTKFSIARTRTAVEYFVNLHNRIRWDNITYYNASPPFNYFKEYIECCENQNSYLELCNIYNQNIEKNENIENNKLDLEIDLNNIVYIEDKEFEELKTKLNNIEYLELCNIYNRVEIFKENFEYKKEDVINVIIEKYYGEHWNMIDTLINCD